MSLELSHPAFHHLGTCIEDACADRRSAVGVASDFMERVLSHPDVVAAVLPWLLRKQLPTADPSPVYLVEEPWTVPSWRVFINGVQVGWVQRPTEQFWGYVERFEPSPTTALATKCATLKDARDLVASVWLERHGLILRPT